jgi:hypothetical protein
MNRRARVASGAAWYLALLLLIPGISTYWTFLAFGGAPSAPGHSLIVHAYSVVCVCILLAFFWLGEQRRLIFAAFVLSLCGLYVYADVPTLDRILAFVTCAALIGIVLEFYRQNLPLFRGLAASNVRLTPILLKTLLLWSPALVFVGLGLLLNHVIVEQVKQSLYDSRLIDEYCEISDASARPLIPCTTLDGRLGPGAVVELPLKESVARHVETLFLLSKRATLEDLSSRPPELWANRNALMKEVNALQNTLQPTAMLGLQRAVPQPFQGYGADPVIRELLERLRLVEVKATRAPRWVRGPVWFPILNPLHARLNTESVNLRKAIRLRQEALIAQERKKDPLGFEIRSLRSEASIELGRINTAPAFIALRSELERQLVKKATPGEVSATARIGLLRIMTNLEDQTSKRLGGVLQPRGAIAYDAGIVRRLCRLDFAREGENEDTVIDCPAPRREDGWSVTPVSFRDSIDLSIRRWHELRERALERGLVDSGLMAARTAEDVKGSHAKLWIGDSPLPRRIGLGVRQCGVLNLGCHISNYAKRTAESAYEDARRDLRRTSIQSVNRRADAGASTANEQIDAVRSELYTGLGETRRAIESSIDQIAKAGAIASALLQLWLALAIIKSLLYVLATEVFHVKGPSEIGLESDATAEGTYRVSTAIEIPAAFGIPLNTTVVGINQGKRTVVPQPFAAMLTRIVQWKWALHRGTRVGTAPIRFAQPGGQTGVVWTMQEGEEVVFRYRDLLGFSDNVRLGTTISLRLSTLLFGRYVYHTARSVGGPALLLLSVKGQVEETQDAVEAFPLERLIAWNKHTKFRVTDDRTFGAVFKDGFIVQTVRQHGTSSGLVLVGAPTTRTALVQGTVRFVGVFVMPF